MHSSHSASNPSFAAAPSCTTLKKDGNGRVVELRTALEEQVHQHCFARADLAMNAQRRRHAELEFVCAHGVDVLHRMVRDEQMLDFVIIVIDGRQARVIGQQRV